MDPRCHVLSALGSGPVVDRYVQETRERTKRLMAERAVEIEAGMEHLTPAAELDKDRYGGRK